VIKVRVVFAPSGVALSVEDDGRGFDPEHVRGLREGHFGLQGMRERVKRLGGKLDIVSAVGSGTRIVAFVPAQAFDAVLAN
jgi:signal transduction histidine kinase